MRWPASRQNFKEDFLNTVKEDHIVHQQAALNARSHITMSTSLNHPSTTHSSQANPRSSALLPLYPTKQYQKENNMARKKLFPHHLNFTKPSFHLPPRTEPPRFPNHIAPQTPHSPSRPLFDGDDYFSHQPRTPAICDASSVYAPAYSVLTPIHVYGRVSSVPPSAVSLLSGTSSLSLSLAPTALASASSLKHVHIPVSERNSAYESLYYDYGVRLKISRDWRVLWGKKGMVNKVGRRVGKWFRRRDVVAGETRGERR